MSDVPTLPSGKRKSGDGGAVSGTSSPATAHGFDTPDVNPLIPSSIEFSAVFSAAADARDKRILDLLTRLEAEDRVTAHAARLIAAPPEDGQVQVPLFEYFANTDDPDRQ
jgi:hypothetical protein